MSEPKSTYPTPRTDAARGSIHIRIGAEQSFVEDPEGDYVPVSIAADLEQQAQLEKQRYDELRDGIAQNISCGACAEGVFCGSINAAIPHAPDCIYSKLECLEPLQQHLLALLNELARLDGLTPRRAGDNTHVTAADWQGLLQAAVNLRRAWTPAAKLVNYGKLTIEYTDAPEGATEAPPPHSMQPKLPQELEDQIWALTANINGTYAEGSDRDAVISLANWLLITQGASSLNRLMGAWKHGTPKPA